METAARRRTLFNWVAKRLLPSAVFTCILVVAACGAASEPFIARGVIVELEADDIIIWETVTIRTSDGETLTFLRGDTVDLRFWRASHLDEHRVLGSPVTVEYIRGDGGLVAVAFSD